MGGSKYRHHAATAAIEWAGGGVVSVTMGGPLVLDGLLAIKRQVLAWRAPGRTLAFVADYRRCALALTGPELDQVLAGEPPDAGAGLPAAMIATPAQVELLRGHAARMALAGHFRRVFLDPQEGLTWAQSMASRHLG